MEHAQAAEEVDDSDPAELPWPAWALAGAERAYRQESRRHRRRAVLRALPCGRALVNEFDSFRRGEFFFSLGGEFRPVPRLVELIFRWFFLPRKLLGGPRKRRDSSDLEFGEPFEPSPADQLLHCLIGYARRCSCITLTPNGDLLLGRDYVTDLRLNTLAAADLRIAVATTCWPTACVAAEGACLAVQTPLYRRWILNLAKTGNGGVRLDAYPDGPAVPYNQIDWSV